MRVSNTIRIARYYPLTVTRRIAVTSLVLAVFTGLVLSGQVFAQQARWIWNGHQISGNVPKGSIHFRKRFTLPKPEVAELVIAADDEFEVYFNNELVGYGVGYDKLTRIDLTPFLIDGENLLAVRVTNIEGNTGAMAAIARFRLEGETAWRWLATDETWTSVQRVDPSWKNIGFQDGRWPASQSLGVFGQTAPWDATRMTQETAPTETVDRKPEMTAPEEKVALPANPATTESETETASTAAQTASTLPQADSTASQTDSIETDSIASRSDSQSAQPDKLETGTETELANQDTNRTAPIVGRLQPKTTTQKKREARLATSDDPGPDEDQRQFTVPENFTVQRVLDESIGSLIAMEFNEFGQLIMSQEGGTLLLADFSNSEKGQITVRKCCDQLENVQGILPLNGQLYVTGQGPQGMGLYRLSDKDRDGAYEDVAKLVSFEGKPGEHGPHGIVLGPEGMLYVIIGNASGVEGELHEHSPSTDFYEGTLLPRIEDPAGHAAGVKAPGGTIVRVSPDGSRKEIFASGLRNAYDLAFNKHGDLFFHDSDMESDIGTPWYRPTQVFHATAGGEYGWRSGTAKFPGYYLDTIPGIADTGRGSPTGAVVYDHVMMPVRYHGSLFLGDWSEGRILSVRMTPENDTYTTEVETFLAAQPLTVTDLAVGPDGALYFSTGGRGTQGGVYRVAWNGQVPDKYRLLDDKLSQLVGRPQPQAAWSRQQLAKLKTSMGDDWETSLNGILMEKRNDTAYRLRALEILGLYGPQPTDESLMSLATDQNAAIRERAIQLIGWRTVPQFKDVVIQALSDEAPRVRRVACETLRHLGHTTHWSRYQNSLASISRSEAMAARRLLESTPTEQWRDGILEADNLRVFLQGATALMIVEPNLQNAYRILARVSSTMDGFINDQDFVDLLRVTQLALDRGNVDPARIPLFHDRILAEFPTGNGILNRELSRIIGYLKDTRVKKQIEDYLTSGADSDLDKLQVILNFRGISEEFDNQQRMAVISFIEQMRAAPATSESNYSSYLGSILENWSSNVSGDQISQILKNGDRWPSAALAAFYKLPDQLSEEQVGWISEMDRKLKERSDSAAQQTRIGCIAVLGRSADEKSMSYLREAWQQEPERRNDLALALAQKPDGPNWPYLVSSLPELNDDTASEVFTQLASVDKSPKEPQFLKDAILAGYRLRQTGSNSVDKLLQHWTGQEVQGSDWKAVIKAWAQWFNQNYPEEQPISFEDQLIIGNHSVDEILTFMESANRPAEIHSGMVAFAKAQCTQCHRFKGQGESMGPDLSSIARRFSKRETLRAILHPSEVVPSQYASKKVMTVDGKQYVGLVSETESGSILLLTDQGRKITLAKDDIEEMVDSQLSAMPEGLLDQLSLQEISDLVGFLYAETQKTADARHQDENATR